MVNTAARLPAEAAPGELIMTEETYAHAAKEFPEAVPRALELKGKSEPVRVRSAKLW